MRIHPRLHFKPNEVITSRSMHLFVMGRAHRTRTVPWPSPRSVFRGHHRFSSWGAHIARAPYRDRSVTVRFPARQNLADSAVVPSVTVHGGLRFLAAARSSLREWLMYRNSKDFVEQRSRVG